MAPRLVVAVFLVAQLFDGIFTYMAIQQFGVWAEGNPLLATWIALVGPQPAIVGAKVMASACGLLLYSARRHRVLGWLTLLYGAVAVGPWVAAFHQI